MHSKNWRFLLMLLALWFVIVPVLLAFKAQADFVPIDLERNCDYRAPDYVECMTRPQPGAQVPLVTEFYLASVAASVLYALPFAAVIILLLMNTEAGLREKQHEK